MLGLYIRVITIIVMNRIFIDRVNELEILNECLQSKKFEFIVVFGRRRVGKTELLKEFIKDKTSLYFLCSNRKITYNLKKFSERVCQFINIPSVTFNSFQDAFDAILSKMREKTIIVIDEFGYLVRRDSGILSDFQEIVDEKLKGSNTMLILCDSSVSMMETRVLGYKSPLYGRATRYIKVEPFDFLTLKLWFQNTPYEDIVKIYSITNGVAKYLEFFSGKDVEEEIVRNFFDPSSFLFEDALRLLSDELRDYSTYIQVLEAIGLGYNRINEIADYAFIQPKDVFFYLKVLSSLGIVKRIVPIFSPKRVKRGLYVIDDNYFNFWFRFVSPFQAEIESGMQEIAVENFKNNFNSYVGIVFEKIVQQLLYKKRILPFNITKIGKWWYKDREIDLVAVNEKDKQAAFLEVKWSRLREEEVLKIIDWIKKVCKEIRWFRDKRTEHFGVIAKEIENKEKLRKEGYIVFDLKDLT